MKLWLLPLLFALSPAAVADESKPYQNWGLQCPDEGPCVLSQRVFLQDAKTPLVTVAFVQLGEKKQLHLLLRVPLGVALSAGVQLQVDQGEAMRWPFSHCDREGCLAVQPMPEPLKAAFRAGREGHVTFGSLDGKGVSVPVSLLGFSAGLKALEKGKP